MAPARSAAAAAATASTSRLSAAGDRGEDRRGAAAPAGRGAQHRPDRAGQRVRRPAGRGASAGHRRGQRQIVGPPGVDPAEHRLDQPVDHLVAEPAPDQRADRDVLVRAEQRAAAVAVPRPRAGCASGGSASRSPGTPTSVPAGDRMQYAVRWRWPPGWSAGGRARRPAPPAGPARRRPSRRRPGHGSGTPRRRTRRSPRPPCRCAACRRGRALCSYTVMPVPAGARSRSRSAAASPAIPPPTTAMCVLTPTTLTGGRRREQPPR